MYELINDLIDQQSKKAAVSKIKPTSSATLRQTIFDLVSTENSRVPVERRVSQRAAFTVAARSLNRTAKLEAKSRFFAAYRDVAAFTSLAIDGNVSELSAKNIDLLPVGHPNSTRTHSMTASAYRQVCARWVAADPRIDDSARELVASAYMHDIGSIEYTHAATRLSAITAGLVPRDIIITAITAAFSFGTGNSSAARSARVKLQWRDRKGRWIEMGRGIGFKVNLPGGAAPSVGSFVGMGSTPDVGLVQIKGDANLPDGIYPIKSNNAEAFKAILTKEQTGGLGSKLSQLLDARANIPTLDELKALRMDAPEGWTKNKDGSFKSDDNYVVKGQDGAFELFREDKNGDLGTKVGDAKSWAEVQDLANADQKSYDDFKRITNADVNKDVLPGQETDPYDNLPAGTKAFLKEQDDKKTADEKQWEERKLAENETISKQEALFDQGKDSQGRNIPEGWAVQVKNGIPNFNDYVKIVDNIEMLAYVESNGEIRFGHRADWFNKNENGTGGYDTWEEVEQQFPRVIKWVGDSKNLQYDPANPFVKDSIPVPHPDKQDAIAEIPQKTDGKPAAKNVKEKAPVQPVPAVQEEASSSSEFDPANFITPDGAYKLQVSSFEPEGRYDDSLSKDYTDDPSVLANKFTEDELKQALSQALIGTKDFATQFLEELADEPSVDDEEAPAAKSKPGPKPKKPAKSTAASGSGLLEFNSGEDFVQAEAIYLALKDQGSEVDQFVADLYDSQLGQNTNSTLLNNLTKEESIKAQEPSAIIERFDLDPNMYKAYHQIAAPDIASVATQQMNDAISKPEDNEQLLKIAAEIKSMKGTQGYKKLLNDHVDLAFSDNPDDQAAFRGMWGLLISIDGGATDEFEVTEFTDAVHSAITSYKGSDMAPNEFSAFMNKYGFFDELIQGKIDIAQGRTDIQDPDSTAGAFYRLVAQITEPNTAELYRGISLKEGSAALDHYVNEGNIVSIDPRSFSDDKMTAGNFADAFTSVGGSSVIFTLPKGEGSSVNLTSVSMFTDEREHLTWGDYRVTEVRKKEVKGGKFLYNVKLEKVSERDSVLDGYSSNSDQFLLTNEEVSLPSSYYTPSVESYTPQLDPSSDTPDDPLYIARSWESQDLIDVYQGGIEDGSGKATLVYPVDGGKDTVVDVEAVRDALQIQGIDTNQILNDIANTEPNVPASEEEIAPAESNVDNPIDQLAEDIATEYNLEGWKKVGPQQGSNEGGTYEDAEGNQYYVKTPKSELHAQNEILASALYRALGINSAEFYQGSADDGVQKIYSPIVEGAVPNLDEKLKDKAYMEKLQEGFAVDAWLANWDVAGLVYDNVVTDANDEPVRVDPGGALLFRAMGAPKGSLFSSEVSELDTLRDKNMNPQSASLFGSMTDEQQKASAAKLLDISPDEISVLVDSVITDPKVAEKLTDTLVQRRQNILDRYDLLAEDTSITVQNTDTTPEEKIQTPDTPETMLDTLYGWANEYKDPTYGTFPSDAKQFDTIANQVDAVLVDYRNGDITDAQLPGVLDELYNFIDTYDWKGAKDEQTQNNVSDLLEQIDAINEKVAPQESTPAVAETPATPETPSAPSEPGLPANAHEYKTSDGVTITVGMKVKYKKTGEIVTVTKYNSNNDSGYIYVTGESFKKPAVKSTKQLVSIDNGSGGEEAPKAPEAPSAPEPATPEVPSAPEPTATAYSADFPFGENADLNKAANDLTKTFANGMPEGGEVIAVNEQSGMIAVTPDGEAVYIFDGKKNTNYTSEGKPDYFKPGGAGDVYKWRPLTPDENAAITKKIADNAVPYGEIPVSPDDEGVGVDAVDNTASDTTLEPPADAVTAPDANSNVLWAGVEVTDKTGATGVITKVNKDGYAFVKFDDGTTKWRSSKTLQGTGSVKEGVSVSANKPKLSKKATGAGVAPVKVEKPSDWATSEFDSVPSVADAIKTVMDTSTPGAGMRGASAVVDSDSIEDLDVRFMHVYDENGNDGVQAKFKLTNWAAKKRVKDILAMSSDERKANGIEITNFSIDDMTIDEKGVGHVHKGASQVNTNLGYNYVIRTADGVTITIHRANKDDSTKFVSSYSSKAPKAFHNLVTIQAPANATPETIANALGQAGVADVRPATPADSRILIENRLMSIFDAQTDANLNLKEKAREASLTRIADKWGITPDDVVVTTGASGRIETRLSPEGAQKIWEATGKPAAIFHNVSVPYLGGGDEAQADWLVNLFGGPQGGLLSTSTRWTEGIGTKGMSSHADVGTGGAEYVFTKPVANASAKEYGVQGTSPHILFDPLKIYQRLDFYANQQDAYGKRSKNKDVISAAKVGAYEVMFKHRMGWEDLDVVVMSPTMRSLVLGKLKDKGVTQLGGRPIEEVIVIGTKQKEEGN